MIVHDSWWWSNGSARSTIIDYHEPFDQGFTVISAVKSKIWSPIALDMVYPQHLLLEMFVYQENYVSIKSVEFGIKIKSR